MGPIAIGSLIKSIWDIGDDLITTDEEKLKLGLQEQVILNELSKNQTEVNKIEAQSSNRFASGWRPFIGWIGGISLAYQFIVYPILVWIWAVLQAYIIIPQGIAVPPVFDTGPLMAIITGMLGIGGMRSFDKLKKTTK